MTDVQFEILAQAKSGTLLEAIFNRYGKLALKADDPVLLAIIDLHNAKKIDVLSILDANAIKPYSGHVFFKGATLYRHLISRLDTNVKSLLPVVNTLLEAAGQDMAASLYADEFAKWCGLVPSRPGELLALIDAKLENADQFLVIALKQGVSIDRNYFLNRAYEFLTNGTEVQKQGAIHALGQVNLTTDMEWRRWLKELTKLLSSKQSDRTNAVLLTSIVRCMKSAPTKHQVRLSNIAVKIITSLGDHLLDAAARAIAFDLVDLTDRLLDALVDALRSIKGENLGTLEILDLSLLKLIESGNVERARHLMEALIGRESDPIDPSKFDAVWYKLREMGGDTQSDWIVSWLLNGDYALCKALEHELFGASVDNILLNVDFNRYSLRGVDYPYLARKAITTFFIKPELMISILVSLLRSSPSGQAQAITDLLFSPVLVNYSSAGETYLNSVANNAADPAHVFAKQALRQRDDYVEGLRSIGNVPELHVSERERTIEVQRRFDMMSAAYDEARQKSVLASLVTETVLLYGTRSVSWVTHGATPPHRIETPLASISHSIELPRVDTIDPIEIDLILSTFRREKRPA